MSWQGAPADPSESWPAPAGVAGAFGLRTDNLDLVPVAGAWTNRLFRLRAGGDSFALKELRNPWDAPRLLEWVDASFQLEDRAVDAGVRAPEPVLTRSDGAVIAWVERQGLDGLVPVRLHRWVEGRPCPAGPVEASVADWAGETLAVLHGLELSVADRSLFPTPNTESAERWAALVAVAYQADSSLAQDMADLAHVVDRAAALARDGLGRDSYEVLSHGDIDQKNIVLSTAGPVLCDWDYAAPWVPTRELVDVALSLGYRDYDIARRVVASYERSSGRAVHLDGSDLAPSLMIGLDWVVLNVERAIGLRVTTSEERELAARLVPDLLAEFRHAVELAESVPSLLSLRSPMPEMSAVDPIDNDINNALNA